MRQPGKGEYEAEVDVFHPDASSSLEDAGRLDWAKADVSPVWDQGRRWLRRMRSLPAPETGFEGVGERQAGHVSIKISHACAV